MKRNWSFYDTTSMQSKSKQREQGIMHFRTYLNFVHFHTRWNFQCISKLGEVFSAFQNKVKIVGDHFSQNEVLF